MKNQTTEMFDFDLMKHFYDPKYESNEKVLDAWFFYVMKFLPVVSKQWRDSLANDKLKHQKSMFYSITISDEALVRWFMLLWLPIIEKRKANNWNNEGKSTGKGPHDTKHNIKIYTLLHNDIETARKDHHAAVRWNNIFWSEVNKRNLIVMVKQQPKYTNIANASSYLPLPDLNEDQEFLATFTIDIKTEDNLESSTDDVKDMLLNDDDIKGTQSFGV